MAALDFPSSPSNGQLYPNPAVSGQPQYTYDGEKWTGGAGVGNVYIADSPPAAPVGSLWYESDTGMLYVRYYDGDSTQWVAIPGGPGDAVRYGAQTLTETQKTQARSNVYAAPLDALAYSGMQINGSMEVSQERGTTATSSTGYLCDGWRMASAGTMIVNAGMTITSLNPGFPAYLYTAITTAQASLGAADFVIVYQSIEGYRVSRLAWGTLNAQPITIGFWASHTPSGTYSGVVRNGANNRSYAFTYTQTASNVAEYKTVTIPGDTTGTWATDNTGGMSIFFALGSGTTNTAPSANTWLTGSYIAAPGQINGAAAVNNALRITGVVVLPGIEAPSAARSPLIMRPYDKELVTCQRYYGKSYRYDQAPGTIATDNQIAYISNSNHGEWGPTISYTVEMRALPTYVVYSPATGASSKRRNLSTGVDETMTGFNIPGTKSHSGANAGHASGTQVYAYHFTRDARL